MDLMRDQQAHWVRSLGLAVADPLVVRHRRGLVALLAGAGLAHLVVPGPYDSIVPGWVPGAARSWTYASGVAELACAVAVALPRTRRMGAGAAAALFVAVFPANVQMAWQWRHRSWWARGIAFGRLPVQMPLVAWALSVRRHAVAGGTAVR